MRFVVWLLVTVAGAVAAGWWVGEKGYRTGLTGNGGGSPRLLDQQLSQSSGADNSDSLIVLMAAGDLMPGRAVNIKLREINNFDYPFANNLFAGADLVLVNLESPVTADCPNRPDGFKFCADWRIVPAMARAGINVVNLANNHMGNEGKVGIEQTKLALRASGIRYTGTQEEVIWEKSGIRVGFLGFNDVGRCPVGIECADMTKVEDRIKSLRKSVDLVVAQFHWGEEYTSKHNKRQQTLARAAIDWGADLVLGAHPHWVQGSEIYKGKLVVYSLGNYIFDQQWSRETQLGVIGKFLLGKRGLMGYEFLPIVVDKSFQPRWAEGREKEEILKRLVK